MTDREHTASRAGHAAEGHARNVADSATEHARNVADEAITQAQSVAEQGMTELRHQADEQAERAADYLDDLCSQLRGMAKGERAPEGVLADALTEGAERIERFASHLHTGGYEAALDDTRRFARRRPGMFLASAFGAGLAIGRVLRNTELSHLTGNNGAGNGARSGSTTGPIDRPRPSTDDPTLAAAGPRPAPGPGPTPPLDPLAPSGGRAPDPSRIRP